MRESRPVGPLTGRRPVASPLKRTVSTVWEGAEDGDETDHRSYARVCSWRRRRVVVGVLGLLVACTTLLAFMPTLSSGPSTTTLSSSPTTTATRPLSRRVAPALQRALARTSHEDSEVEGLVGVGPAGGSESSESVGTPAAPSFVRNITTGFLVETFESVTRAHAALLPILRANKVATPSVPRGGVEPRDPTPADEAAAAELYTSELARLTRALSADHLRRREWSKFDGDDDGGGASSLPSSFSSSSTFRLSSTSQVFSHVCLVFGDRPQKMSMLLVEDGATRNLSRALQAYQSSMQPTAWIPRQAEGQHWPWRSIDHKEVDPKWPYLPGTTLAQVTWDSNVGHHFHLQIAPVRAHRVQNVGWPASSSSRSIFSRAGSASSSFSQIMILLTSAEKFSLPRVDHLLLDDGCMVTEADRASRPFFHQALSFWPAMSRLLARTALEARVDTRDLDLVSGECTTASAPGAKPRPSQDTLCFEKLLLPAPEDVFLRNPSETGGQAASVQKKEGGERNDMHWSVLLTECRFCFPPSLFLSSSSSTSGAAVRAFRKTLLTSLALPDAAVNVSSSLASSSPSSSSSAVRPLRITIYTRRDSSRRRLLNAADVRRVLGRTHVVRIIDNLGGRSPSEQLALLAHTDVLIAPHGAHITFTLVMPRGAIVLEYHAGPGESWMRGPLDASGIRIVEMRGETALHPRALDGAVLARAGLRDMDRDFEVDLGALCDTMKRLDIHGCDINHAPDAHEAA